MSFICPIQRELQHLKDWCNGVMIGNLMTKYNVNAIRDISGIPSKDAAHRLRFGVVPDSCDKNHGWGKLKERDFEVHGLQFRYWDTVRLPLITTTFEQYLSKQNNG